MASTGEIIVLKCRECGDEFAHTVKNRGRYPIFCARHRTMAEHSRRYRQTEKGKAASRRGNALKVERYDPWRWENTILEWNE